MPRVFDAELPVALVPVVEVEPYRYSNVEMPSHDQWALYFERCMADAGFQDVSPIGPRSRFVRATSLVGNPLLERMTGDKLNGSGLSGFSLDPWLTDREPLDRVSSFYGGLALIASGEVLLEPNCCGGLSDIRGWETALEAAPQPATVWIGHPELELEFMDDRVLLCEGREYHQRLGTLVEVSLTFTSLRHALSLAQVEQLRFRDDLVPMVSRLLGSADLGHDVASRLAGLT